MQLFGPLNRLVRMNPCFEAVDITPEEETDGPARPILTYFINDLYYSNMNRMDVAFGSLLREKREHFLLSQVELARKVQWPQSRVSRLEQGRRSVTLPELMDLAGAFGCSVSEMFGKMGGGAGSKMTEPTRFSAGFAAAFEDEETALAQLERLGVRFLGGGRRATFVDLSPEETVLAALRHSGDPRVFEALPSVVLGRARTLDWAMLASGAYALRLQNRLGMVVSVALRLTDDAEIGATLQAAHDALAQAKLDREEVVGPRPKTEAGLSALRTSTPDWLRFWHAMGAGDLESCRRHLPR